MAQNSIKIKNETLFNSMMSMCILIPVLAFCLFFMSCKTVKKESDPGDQTLTKQDTTVQPYVFKECASKDDCVMLFDCYHDFFFYPSLLDYKTQEVSNRYFDFGKLLECTVYVFNNDNSRKELADQCLFKFCQYSFEKCVKSGNITMPYGNLTNFSLKNWNSKRSFTAFLLLMSKNDHYSMGHGDCTNVGYEFFICIVLPKIKSVDGVDFWSYYFRSNPTHLSPSYVDCYDRFYATMYPLLKKAWEEGKIELHAPEHK